VSASERDDKERRQGRGACIRREQDCELE